ncbi:MAG: pyridoxamine 5'-phosphate oxidase family protein [Candidatus Levybacteria bacterium]|nr:pyridoxamine 5'-phosphate oxidase family protein [Candidatus Levybacteria bacterium]
MIFSRIDNEKREVLLFLKKNVLATISTVNPQSLQPESALVAFCELDALEILITTLKGSRKYENLLKNDKVALVIGWEADPKRWATLQYEGKALEVGAQEESSYKKLFLKKEGSPCTEVFFQKSDMKLFKITPTWIGFSRFPQNQKPKVIELRF